MPNSNELRAMSAMTTLQKDTDRQQLWVQLVLNSGCKTPMLEILSRLSPSKCIRSLRICAKLCWLLRQAQSWKSAFRLFSCIHNFAQPNCVLQLIVFLAAFAVCHVVFSHPVVRVSAICWIRKR